jgi:hypothetical protein
MQSIEIDKHVPIPRHGNTGRRSSPYPFLEMQVGESFFVPNGKRNTLAHYATHFRYTVGKTFTVRAWEENGARGFRVWRTK